MSNFHSTILGCQNYDRQSRQLISLIAEEITLYHYTNVCACAAYVSYRGVIRLRAAFSDQRNVTFRWLFGLDDYITDPQAIRVATGTRNAETRLVPITPGRRFHAKAYLLSGSTSEAASLIVGSANLTEAALTKNCEAFSVIRANNNPQVTALENYWDLLWQMGRPASSQSISQYEDERRRRRIRYSEVNRESTAVPANPKTNRLVRQSLPTSKLAWIDLGFNTGGGNQLDIVKKLAPFLGLPSNPSEGATSYLTFDSPLGRKRFQLTFTKGMWRFMNLQQGFREPLRPDIRKRSPYVLVISREKAGDPTLSIQRVGSEDTKRMINESRKNGFIDSSVRGPSGRLFGWY